MPVRASQASQICFVVKHADRGSCSRAASQSRIHQSRCYRGRAPAAAPSPPTTRAMTGVLIRSFWEFHLSDFSLFSVFVLPIQVIVRCSRVMVFSLF